MGTPESGTVTLDDRYIFLSAGIPVGELPGDADRDEIAAAVRAAVSGVLLAGGRLLFGGQPGIVPLVLDVAQDLAGQDPQVAQELAPYQGLGGSIAVILYGGLILVAIFGQGGLAYYYFTRRKALEIYLEKTPQWILAMQSQGMKL